MAARTAMSRSRSARFDARRSFTPAPSCCSASIAFLQRPLYLTASVSFGQVTTLVARLLAASNGDLDLGASVLEVQPRGNERQATFANLADERGDLAAVQQELPVPVRIVIREVSLRVLGDVSTDEIDLLTAHVRERALKTRASLAERFHFGAREDNPRLEAFEEVVVVAGTTVLSDDLYAPRLRHPTDCRRR